MKTNATFGFGPALLIGFVLLAGSALASMRCGTDLVQEGDSKLELLEACGEPDEGNVEFDTDIWFYRLEGAIYEVHISNDKVERIQVTQTSATP
ncbi:MAG: DUF2845 domain-containing protein [Wenzhouxiangellaceae bacterium]|nr:DUF2845 domain-containing protein [Wenzhouxiangellaceae bacterium]